MNPYGCINKMNLYGLIAETCENHKDAQLIDRIKKTPNINTSLFMKKRE